MFYLVLSAHSKCLWMLWWSNWHVYFNSGSIIDTVYNCQAVQGSGSDVKAIAAKLINIY